MSEELNEKEDNLFDMEVSQEDRDNDLIFNPPPPKVNPVVAESLATIRENYRKSGTIKIRPFVNKKHKNMGLEKLGMVVFPGTFQMEDMAAIEFRGKTKYINGLDEYSNEIRMMPEGEAKQAKIHSIRVIISELERERAYNMVDVEDPDFWSKVTMFRPDNKEVWGKMSRKCGNNDIYLNPVKNLDDLLTIIAIENGGFPGIAKSHEDARTSLKGKKWYLDKQEETVNTKANSSKIKNQALGILERLSTENPRKLLYISKLVETSSLLYTFATLPNQIYDNMDDYITGKGTEGDIKKASKLFIEYSETPLGELKIRAALKDAVFLKTIITKGDQLIYKADDNTMLGRNLSEVYEYLINPVNENVLHDVVAKSVAHWSK